MDKAGRVVLPKPLRDDMHLQPGDALEVESSGEDIILRPVCGQAQLHKKHGIWVYRAEEPLPATTVEETVRQIRRERDSRNLSEDQ